MKKILSLVGSLLMFGSLMLLPLSQTFAAQPAHSPSKRPILPKSPVSTGVLLARAIHSGKYHVTHQSKGANPGSPNLGCAPPRPCVIPNAQASDLGTAPANENPIAVNPTHHEHLLTGANDYNCSNIQGFYSSGDGGATWHGTCMATFMGGFGEGDPGVGYDLNNNSFITGIEGGTPDGSNIIFEKSSDNGKTWSAPAAAVSPLFPGGFTDKDWLQIDDNMSSPRKNSLYISVTQFDSSNNSEISVSHSNNHGGTWTTTGVDTQQLFPIVDQFSDLAIGKNGTVYVSWMRCTANGPTGDCGNTTATFLVSKSTDGGNTWSSPATVGTATLAPDTCSAFYGCLPNTFERVSNIPAIDIDNSGGTHNGHLYVVNYNWTGKYMRTQVTTSTNGGTTWGSPLPVAPRSDTHDQFFPWLTVNSNGTVGVSWLDRRNDPSNINYEAFVALSTNGSSFGTNYQIASVASNPFNDGFGGGFMGDYSGNYWSRTDRLYASWPDTRNGSTAQDEVGGLRL